jgi:hypothetical protein
MYSHWGAPGAMMVRRFADWEQGFAHPHGFQNEFPDGPGIAADR